MVVVSTEPTTPTVLSLPSVRYARYRRTRPIPSKDTPYTLPELIQYVTGLHPNLIWGPFFQKFRAARHERDDWADFNLETIWKGIPATAQKRPGLLEKGLSWFVGEDPAPTLAPPPLLSESNTKKSRSASHVDEEGPFLGTRPTTPKSPSVRSRPIVWSNEIQIDKDWSPTQIDFTEWHGRFKHPEDYDDDFYHNTFTALYNALCDCMEKWFGSNVYLEDWRDTDKDISVWEVPMTEQFIQYARVVAHEDRGYVEWRDILDDPAHRKWLCVGIFAQIIERKVFNTLLFGADPEIQKELDRHDSLWILSEGFNRKDGRRPIVRAALNGGLLPANFWNAVDDLAGQTVLIFQPLFTLMCLATNQAPDKSGAMFLQEVHSILAMAGYFQVCMAISPSIFHILSATPGARFQWEEEAHADRELYRMSKEFHESHNSRWRLLADANLKSSNRGLQALMKDVTDPADMAAYTPLPNTEKDYRQRDHYRRRGGKVMYAVFPKLTRYRAENVGQLLVDPRTPMSSQELVETGEGMRITILSKCYVVYYQGLIYSPTDADDGTTLESHLHEIALSRMKAHFLPYLRRSWDGDGSQKYELHWPLWPETVDRFWLWWLVSLSVSTIFRHLAAASSFDAYLPPANDLLTQVLLYKTLGWYFFEAVIYLIARAQNSSFLSGHGRYWKLQLINIGVVIAAQLLTALSESDIRIFSLLAIPLAWLDAILLGGIPKIITDAGYTLRSEDAASAVRQASIALGQLFGNATSGLYDC